MTTIASALVICDCVKGRWIGSREQGLFGIDTILQPPKDFKAKVNTIIMAIKVELAIFPG